MTKLLAAAKDVLPPGLRQVSPDRYLIQLRRYGRTLTRRVRGTRAEALRALEVARVDVELAHRGQVAPSPAQAPQGASPMPEPVARVAPVGSPTPTPSRAPAPPARHAPVATTSCPTLAEFVAGRYSQQQERRQSPATRKKLESVIKSLLASPLGPLPLAAIRYAQINDFARWRADGDAVSASTINKSLVVLQSVLKFAHREEVIDRVPPFEMLPQTDAKRVHGPNKEEFAKLLKAAENMRVSTGPRDPGVPWLPEVLQLFAEFGFRPGELFHLTWGSVDFNHKGGGEGLRGAVHVEEQTKRGFTPKGGKRRLIPMSAIAREVLLKLKAAQPNAKPDDLVVPNDKGRPYIHLGDGENAGGGTSTWKRLSRLSGVKINMYAIRHRFAETRLIAGVPIHVVSKWMGHSKVELTSKTYGHFAPDNADQWRWVNASAEPASGHAEGSTST